MNNQAITEPKTITDYNYISAITKRGIELLNQSDAGVKYFDLFLDVEYCHQANPLRLAEFSAADNANFAHDIIGIYLNFNRVTKQLDNCFSPRYSK